MIIILGPTSSGKTTVAMEMSKYFNIEIISADSRQVYKYFDIGTGKLPVSIKDNNIEKNDSYWVINGIKIWGYDLVNPDKVYSAFDFKDFAIKREKDILARKKTPIVVGGTGFYIDALTGLKNLSNIPLNESLRIQLQDVSCDQLVERLKSFNPTRAGDIDVKNPRRLIRAIEIEEYLNVNPLYGIENISSNEKKIKDSLQIGLFSDREELYLRADKWVDNIWDKLIKETDSLLKSGFENTPPIQGLVYKTSVAFMKGYFGKDEAIQRIKFDIHAYIRRQQTWFRKNPNIKWIDIKDHNYIINIKNLIQSYLKDGT
jgi:tRNA dimethylallyltransferase